MDCRTSPLMALVLVLGLGSGGCMTTQTTQTPQPLSGTQNSKEALRGDLAKGDVVRGGLPDPPPGTVVKKAKEGPKRQAPPSIAVALAVIKEREAERARDNPEQQMKLRDAARLFYQEALRVDPDYQEAIAGLARVYTRLGEFNRAIDLYTKALAKHPGDAKLWFGVGMCHNCNKDFQQGARCLAKALELDPENRQYMQNLGFTLGRAGEWDESLVYLTRALGPAGAHLNLAKMLMHLRQPEQCQQHLRLALQADPSLEEARQMLVRLDPPARSAPLQSESLQAAPLSGATLGFITE